MGDIQMTLEEFNKIANKINLEMIKMETSPMFGFSGSVYYHIHLKGEREPFQVPSYYGETTDMTAGE